MVGRFYNVTLNIGQAPRPYFLDVDTGSDLTWLQCDAPCIHCSEVHNSFILIIYLWITDHVKSDYFLWLHFSDAPSTLSTQQRLSSMQGPPLCIVAGIWRLRVWRPQSMSLRNWVCRSLFNSWCTSQGCLHSQLHQRSPTQSSHGSWVSLPFCQCMFLLKHCSVPSFSYYLLNRCGYDQIFPASSYHPLDGVLGLGRGKTSLVSQLHGQGLVRNVVGHCLSAKGGGYIFFGDVYDSSRVVWTSMSSRHHS